MDKQVAAHIDTDRVEDGFKIGDKFSMRESKAERKRREAEEHNRRYEYNKANPKSHRVIIAEAMADAVKVFKRDLKV